MPEISTKTKNKINILSISYDKDNDNLKPNEKPAIFDIIVSNDSNIDADLQLKLNHINQDLPKELYRLTPSSSLIPSGTSAKFSVEIFDIPRDAFNGETTTNITVRAFCRPPQHGNAQEWISEKTITVKIDQAKSLNPVKLELVSKNLQQAPEVEFQISVKVTNPNKIPINVNLKLRGLNISWIKDSKNELSLKLEPGEEQQQDFYLQLPTIKETVSQDYPFTVEANAINSQQSTVYGTLTITPQGKLELNIKPERLQEITTPPGGKFWLANNIEYQVILSNNSNVHQEEIKIEPEIEPKNAPKCNLKLSPRTVQLKPGETTNNTELTVSATRNWIGKPQKIRPIIKAIWSQPESLKVIDEKEIEFVIKPIIPYWLQLGGIGLLLLCLFWWILFKPPTKHAASVNSVQFNGVGDSIISGSDDQTIINWRVSGFNAWKFWANPKIRQMSYQDKSVRRVRIKPVDNNLVAVALENGEMQVWDLLSNSKDPKYCFSAQKDDRVFGLEFSRDSRYLFSGHGNMLIYPWNLQDIPKCGSNASSNSTENQEQSGKTKTPNPIKLDFGIESLKFVGKDNRNLAIAGRYNKLIIWNLQKNIIKKVNYSQGGQNDYITSLAIAESQPNLLFTSDNQGKMTVLDITDCLEEDNTTCGIEKHQWDNPNQQAVNSVAVSDNGCYLAAGTQDGKVVFWPVTKEGKLVNQGKEIDHGDEMSSVDIKIVGNDVLIVSGSKDSWVRLKREKRLPQFGCDLQ